MANLLKKADEVTGDGGERRENYAHPAVDFGCTAQLWTALLQRAGLLDDLKEIPTELVPLMMIAVKLSRLGGNLTHYDSALDIAGYARTLEMLWERDELMKGYDTVIDVPIPEDNMKPID